MSTRIPHLLEQYLALPPEAALLLLTSVLGASSNWLTLRFLYSYLKGSSAPVLTGKKEGYGDGGDDDDDGASSVGVVLVSFMRDGAFWREGAGRMGLDLDGLGRRGRFVFVDGLTGLLYSGSDDGKAGDAADTRKDGVLKSSRIGDMQAEITAALAQLRTGRKVLVIDQIDVLLAVSEDEVTSTGISSMLLSLREVSHRFATHRHPCFYFNKTNHGQSVHSTLLTLSADDPFLHSQATTLEREQASLVLGQAHAADRVLALRMLDTGTAKDVSGVVRITRGGGGGESSEGDEEDEEEGREYLYHVSGDGGVRVFERGS